MEVVATSFRDPSGYVFIQDQLVYRFINPCYHAQYAYWKSSGLYDLLIEKKLCIAHEEISYDELGNIQVILPEQIKTITSANEWTFSMLQDAALCTLQIALEALEHGMILKDANTSNIQFVAGKPILIDSLSFEIYEPGKPWQAYQQFCKHFLAPLTLMHYTDASLIKLLQLYPDGIPLDICSRLLPLQSRLNLHAYLHIHLAAKLAGKPQAQHTQKKNHFSTQQLYNLLKGLFQHISKLRPKLAKTTWDDYYSHTILSQTYLAAKKVLVTDFLNQIPGHTVIDWGANDGAFSLLAAQLNKQVIAIDADYNCIDTLYKHCKKQHIHSILPLCMDLMAPTPAMGWQAQERENIFNRISGDISLVLALIHHIAIGHNVPLTKIADWLHESSPYIIIEFVEKQDEKVQELLKHREDIFATYDISHFELAITKRFNILQKKQVGQAYRWLYLLKRITV